MPSRQDINLLQQLTNPTEGNTKFIVVDGSVEQTLSVIDARALLNTEGPTGPTGPRGNTGPSGPTGVKGDSGFSGYSGISGTSGLSGFSGYSGRSGQSGYSGPTGPKGDSGYSGYSSRSGFSGFSGYSGYSSLSGYSGYSSLSGFSGFSGRSGFSGYSGYSGRSGYSSFSGYSGVGATGTSGYSGYSSVSGFSGFSGESGASGYSGESGYSGFSGESGFSGYSGRSGYSGYSSLSGFSGYSGGLGFSGYSGYSGRSGYSGISGQSTSGYSGYSGFSGYSGRSGQSGFSGIGAEGFSGYSGYSGRSGYSGYSGQSGRSGTSGYSGLGPTGDSGYSGNSGYSSRSGFSGVSGYSGRPGAYDASGFSGQSGFSGYSGRPGAYDASGFSGYSGTSGRSGYSGIGAQGFSGYSGPSGFSGIGTKGDSGISGYSGVSGRSGFSGYSGAVGERGAGAAIYEIPETSSATTTWIFLGTFTCTQQGQKVLLKVCSSTGYNADTTQNQYTELYFKTSNNTNFQAGTSSSGQFFGDALATRFISHGPKDNSPTEFRVYQESKTAYRIYGNFSSYTGKSFYFAESEIGAWEHSGTALSGLPPTDKAYINVVPQIGGLTLNNVDNNQIIYNKSSALGGTSKLTYNPTSNLFQVNADAKFTNSLNSEDGFATWESGKVIRIANPGGATADVSTDSAVTGAIAIRLPTAAYNGNTMMSMVIDIYEYDGGANGESKTLTVGGYNYQSGDWYNVFAHQQSMSGVAGVPVRFGRDETRNIIWLGSTSTVWNYPQVSVRNFAGGYSNATPDVWQSGWAINFTTTFDTVSLGPVTPTVGVGENTELRVKSLGVGVAAPTTSGNAVINNDLEVKGLLKVASGAASTKGITFTDNPGGGSGDDAYIQYFEYEGEKTVLELTVSNDSIGGNQDSINLVAPGGVGIGTRTPSVALDVTGSIRASNNLTVVNTISGGYIVGSRIATGYDAEVTGAVSCSNWFRSNGDSGWFNATHGGGIYMSDSTWIRTYNSKSLYVGGGSIATTGDVTAYYSDERLKLKTGNIENALEKVNSLNAFYYVNNDLAKSFGYTSTETQVALSAQEVKEILPEVVKLAPFDMETDDDGNIKSKSGDNYLTVDYAKMVPLLVAAIKELKQELDTLKNNLG